MTNPIQSNSAPAVEKFVTELMQFFTMIQHPRFRESYEDSASPHHEFAVKVMGWLETLTPSIVKIQQEGLAEFGPTIFDLDLGMLKSMSAKLFPNGIPGMPKLF